MIPLGPKVGAVSGGGTRIGIGRDIHRQVIGQPLVVAGVVVPSSNGGEHGPASDALCHAVIDAVLGALALGDMGNYLPSDVAHHQEVGSMFFLGKLMSDLRTREFELINLDANVTIGTVRLAAHLPAMRHELARAFDCPVGRISVKARSNDGLEAVGAGRAISAEAVLLCSASELEAPIAGREGDLDEVPDP